MNTAVKGLLWIFALMFLGLGVGLVLVPAQVAPVLGMPVLDGLGLSSQIGDIGSFFTGGSLMIVLALLQNKKIWFYAPAILVGLTAIFRTLAWLLHDAPLALPQIGLEVVITTLLLVAAQKADG